MPEIVVEQDVLVEIDRLGHVARDQGDMVDPQVLHPVAGHPVLPERADRARPGVLRAAIRSSSKSDYTPLREEQPWPI